MNFNDNNPLPTDPLEASGAAPQPPQPAGASDSSLSQDLRVPWDWLDLLLLGVLALAGSILLNFVVAALFAAFGVSRSQLRASPSEVGLFTIVHQVLLIFGLLGYLAVQIRMSFRAPFWRTIGWRPFEIGKSPRVLRYFGFVAGGFLLAIFVQFMSNAFGNKAKLPIQTLFQDRRTALLLLLMAVFVAPVIEETIFRGYIYPVVARSFGVAGGVVVTGTLFGLLHAPQLWGGWVQIGSLVAVGIIFTYARALTQTVLASFLLHVSYNFFTSFAFLLGSHWLHRIPPTH
jgi:membrane protease YdiL (CAAX protease family)